MLRTAETDALCAELAGLLGVAGRVGVGAYEGLGVLGSEVHDSAEVAVEFGFYGGNLTVVYFAGGAVERDPVAFSVGVSAHFDGLGYVVDLDFACAGDAALAHTAGYYGSVRGHTPTHGEDALGHGHTAEVFGRCLDADENDFALLLGPCLGVLSGEHYLTGSCTGRCGETLGYDSGTLECALVEYGVKEFVEFLGFHAAEDGLLVNDACAEEVHGDLDHSGAGALAVTGLEHPEFAVLDGELHVLHVFVVCFEAVGDGEEFLCAYGHRFLERGILGCADFFRDALEGSPAARAFDGNLLGCADAGYDVLALSVDEVFTVEDVFAGSSVAAESHARSGVVAHVAVDHGLYVDGRTPLFGDLVHAAVDDGAFVHPAVEHGADAAPELFPCVIGEVFAGVFLYGRLEETDEVLEVFNIELGVELDAFLLLDLVHDFLEGVDVGFLFGLHTEHNVAVHLHEAAVAVPCEAGVAALGCERLNGGVVHAEVEDGVHHAGHRGTRA